MVATREKHWWLSVACLLMTDEEMLDCGFDKGIVRQICRREGNEMEKRAPSTGRIA